MTLFFTALNILAIGGSILAVYWARQTRRHYEQAARDFRRAAAGFAQAARSREQRGNEEELAPRSKGQT